MRRNRMCILTIAVLVILAAVPSRAQDRIEAEGRWSDDTREGALVTAVVNCYRVAKACTVVSMAGGGNLMSNDHDVVPWDSKKIVAIGGGDCVTNTLVINLARKTVSMSSASNHEHSKDGVCQQLDKHPEWIEPATLIQPAGGWFLVY